MANRKRSPKVVICLSLLITISILTEGGPIRPSASSGSDEKCASTCSGEQKNFKFVKGTSYEYKFEGSIKTKGNATKSVEVRISTTAVVETLDSCEFVLKLQNTKLLDSDPNRDNQLIQSPISRSFATAVETHPLSFSLDDGKVTSLCPVEQEEAWSLNIKRAVLSSLQSTYIVGISSTPIVREKDISGDCTVEYKVVDGDTVSKSKFLESCYNRQLTDTFLRGVSYRVDSPTQSAQILESSQECNQTFDRTKKLLKLTVCKEKLVYKPVIDDKAEMASDIQSVLTFVKESRAIPTNLESLPTRGKSDLLYDHSADKFEYNEFFKESVLTLNQLKQQSVLNSATPSTFLTLVRQLRKLDFESLKRLEAQAGEERAKNYLYDAVTVLQTPASVSFKRHYFDRVDATRQVTWLTSLLFIKSVTEEMLGDAENFLKSHYDQSVLPISALLHTYLSQPKANPNSPSLKRIVLEINSKIRSNCEKPSLDNENKAKLLISLKALGNAGVTSDVISDGLKKCVLNDKVAMSVRVAVIDSFRRQNCSTPNAILLESLYRNKNLDSELRINAYLQRFRCADEEFIKSLLDDLSDDTEEVQQVASFVYSHLSNLVTSNSPMKSEISKLLQDSTFQRESKSFDFKKFSTNFDYSTFDDDRNLGASAENNVIFSPNSFVPRSASVNLTLDLFGTSVNVFEVGGRIQGVEDLLEKTFSRYDKNKGVDRKINVDANVRNFDNELNKKKLDNPEASFYMRTLGSEFYTEQLFDVPDSDTLASKFNIFPTLLNLANEKTIDKSYTKPLIDLQHTVPTVLGLPIKCSITGVVSVAVKAKGLIDIKSIFQSRPTFEIRGQVRPSATALLSAELGVDSRLIKTGIKNALSLQTNVVVDGTAKYSGGSFTFDYNLPDERMDLLSGESTSYTVHRGQDIMYNNPNVVIVPSIKCTSEKFSQITGLELCGEMTSATLSPTDPGSFVSGKAYLVKKDKLTGYRFEATYIPQIQNNTHFKVSFNTPGSTVNREIFFLTNYTLSPRTNYLNLNSELRSPWLKFKLDTNLNRTITQYNYLVSLEVEGLGRYALESNVGLQTSATAPYTLNVKVISPNFGTIPVVGSLLITDRKTAGRLQVKNPVNIDLNCTINHNARTNKHEANIALTSPWVGVKISGHTSQASEPPSSPRVLKGKMEYTLLNRKTETFNVDLSLKSNFRAGVSENKVDVAFKSSEFPAFSSDGNLEFNYSPSSLSSRLVLKTTGTPGRGKTMVFGFGAVHEMSHYSLKKTGSNFEIVVPQLNLNYAGGFHCERTVDEIHGNVTFSKGDKNVVKGNFDFVDQQRDGLTEIFAQAGSSLGEFFTLELKGEVKEKHRLEYEVKSGFLLQVPNFQVKFQAPGKVKIKHGRTDVDFKFVLNEYEPIRLFGHLSTHWNNVQVKFGVTFDGETYYLQGSNQIERKRGGGAYEQNLNLEVAYRLAKHSVTVKYSSNETVYLLEVVTTLSPEAKYSLSGQVSVTSASPGLGLKLKWPGNNFIVFLFESELTRLDAYNHGLKAKLGLKSSIKNIEEMSLSYKHSFEDENLHGTVVITWNPTQKIVGNLRIVGSYVTANITTPFQSLKSIKFTGDSSNRRWGSTIYSKLAWDDQFVDFNFTLDSYQLPNFEGKIVATSSFRDYDSFVLSVSHKMKPDEIVTHGDVVWTGNKKISIIFKHKVTDTASPITRVGSLVLRTPFPKFENQKLSWSQKENLNSVNGSSELLVFGLKIGANYKYNYISDGPIFKSLTVKGELNSNSTAFKKIGGSLDFNVPAPFINTDGNSKLTLFYNQHNVVLQHTQKFETGLVNVTGSLDIPLIPFKQIKLENKIRYDHSKFKYGTENKLIVTEFGQSTLGGNLNIGPKQTDFDFKFKLTTPVSVIKKLTLELKNEELAHGWKSRGKIDYNEYNFQANSLLKLGDREKVVDLNVSTPFEVLKTFSLAVLVNSTNAKLAKVSVDLEHNILPDKIHTSLNYDVRDFTKKFYLNFLLTTPFEDVSPIRLDLDYHNRNNKHIFIGSFQFNQLINSALNVTLHLLNENHVNIDVALSPSQLQHITSHFSYQIKDSDHEVLLRIATPFETLKKLNFEHKKKGPWRKFESETSLEYDSNRWKAKSEVETKPNNELDGKTLITSNVAGFERINLVLKYRKPNPNDHTVDLDLDSSIEKLPVLKIGIVYKGPWNNINLTTSVKTKDNAYQSAFIFKYNPNINDVLFISFGAGIPNYDMVKLSLSHVGKTLREFQTKLSSVIIMRGEEFIELSYKGDVDDFKTVLKAKTAFVSLPNLEAVLEKKELDLWSFLSDYNLVKSLFTGNEETRQKSNGRLGVTLDAFGSEVGKWVLLLTKDTDPSYSESQVNIETSITDYRKLKFKHNVEKINPTTVKETLTVDSTIPGFEKYRKESTFKKTTAPNGDSTIDGTSQAKLNDRVIYTETFKLKRKRFGMSFSLKSTSDYEYLSKLELDFNSAFFNEGLKVSAVVYGSEYNVDLGLKDGNNLYLTGAGPNEKIDLKYYLSEYRLTGKLLLPIGTAPMSSSGQHLTFQTVLYDAPYDWKYSVELESAFDIFKSFRVNLNQEGRVKVFDFNYNDDRLISVRFDGGEYLLHLKCANPESAYKFGLFLVYTLTPAKQHQAFNCTVDTPNYFADYGSEYISTNNVTITTQKGFHIKLNRTSPKPDFSYRYDSVEDYSVLRTESSDQSLTIQIFEDVDSKFGSSYWYHYDMDKRQTSAKLSVFGMCAKTNEKITITEDVLLGPHVRKLTTTLEHPKLSHPLIVTNSYEEYLARHVYSKSVQFKPGDVYKLEGRLEQEEPRGKINGGNLHLTHELSGLDTDLRFKFTKPRRSDVTEFLLGFRHKLKNEEKRFILSSSYNGFSKDLDVKLECPVHHWHLKTINRKLEVRGSNSIGYDVIFKSHDVLDTKLSVDLEYNIGGDEDILVDLKFYPYTDVATIYYQARAAVEDDEIYVSLNRQKSVDTLVNDYKFGIRLDPDDFLRVTNRVQPRFWVETGNEFKAYLANTERAGNKVTAKFNALMNDMATDIAGKYRQFLHASRDMDEVIEEFWGYLKSVGSHLFSGLQKLYDSNVLYFRDVVNVLKEVFGVIKRVFDVFWKDLNRRIDKAFEEWSVALKEQFKDFSKNLGKAFSAYSSEIHKLYPQLAESSEKIRDHFKKIGDNLKHFIQEIQRNPTIRDFFAGLGSISVQHFRAAFDELYSIFFPEELVTFVLSAVLDFLKEIYTIFDLKEQLANVEDLTNALVVVKSLDTGSQKIGYLVEKYLRLSENKFTHVDRQTGSFELQVFVTSRFRCMLDYLSIWMDFYDDSEDVFQSSLDRWNEVFENVVQSDSWESLFTVLPPYRASASITGHQFIKTFDGRGFNYDGECPLLLTRDHLDKSFLIYLENDQGGQRQASTRASRAKITIHVDDGKFSIRPDGRVAKNGITLDLPYLARTDFGRILIVQLGDNIVEFSSSRGLTVQCNALYDVCDFTVSGWHFGKIAGFLGDYNNEWYDDFKLANGQKVAKPEELAAGWAVLPDPSRKCAVNRAEKSIYDPDSSVYKTCQHLFSPSSITSPYKNCFKNVKPNNYLNFCLAKVPTNTYTDQHGHSHDISNVCRVSAAYAKDCSSYDEYVKMHTDCVQCYDHNKFKTYNASRSFKEQLNDRLTKNADVVYLVELGPCARNFVAKLRNVHAEVQKAFAEAGLTSTRYAFMSYGGQYEFPVYHTINGKIFVSPEDLEKVNVKIEYYDLNYIDGLKAIRYALNLPFRVTASKTIIFVPCDGCHNAERFPATYEAVVKEGVRIQVLWEGNLHFKTQSNAAKSSFLYGYDKDAVYTKKDADVTKPIGDQTLRLSLRQPKNYCTALTYLTGGSVFNLLQFYNAGDATAREFLQVSSRVAAKHAKPTPCQVCTCEAHGCFGALNKCAGCGSKGMTSAQEQWMQDVYHGYYGAQFDDFTISVAEEEKVVTQTPRPLRVGTTPRHPSSRARPS